MSGPAARRPPRLEPAAPPGHRSLEPTPRQRLVGRRVTGRQPGRSRDEVLVGVRQLVAGESRAHLGFERFLGLTVDEVLRCATAVWGWSLDDDRVAIDPARTLGAAVDAFERLGAVAARGGRVAFATAQPASLLALYAALARSLSAAGARVVAGEETPPMRAGGHPGRRLWWVEAVAVLTDGSSLLATTDPDCFDEVLFELAARPELFVADGVFAAGAARRGIDVVAPAGLTSLALGVAARRGMPVTVVPLDEARPPAAYAPLESMAADAIAAAAARPQPPAGTATATSTVARAGDRDHTTHAGHQEAAGVASPWRTEYQG